MPYFELTTLWHQAHPHLRPWTSPTANKKLQRVPCPICDSQEAFEVIADLAFEPAANSPALAEKSKLTFCPACETYSLSASQWQQASAMAQVAVNSPVTSLNAQLWSAQPTFMNIEPTTRCNYSCWYCVGRHMEQRDIEVDDFEQILDHFPTLRAIALVGEGEPLMHKGFFKMAKMASDRGIRVLTLSNGSTFSTSNVAKLCESGISYISVSIDSVDPEKFAASRIGGDLNQVLTGIKRLVAYRDANGYKYPRIGLKGTLFDGTENELPEIVKVAKSCGVDVFESFQALNPMVTYVPIYPAHQLKELNTVNRVAHAIARDSEKTQGILKSAAQFCEEEGIDADKNGTPNGVRPNCDEEWIYTLLSGDVTPCCQIKKSPSENWNLLRRPLIDIMQDADYQNTRFNLWQGIFPDYCAGCWKTRS